MKGMINSNSFCSQFYAHRKIAGDFFYHPAYIDCYHFARFLAENFDDGKARSIDSTAEAEQIFRAFWKRFQNTLRL